MAEEMDYEATFADLRARAENIGCDLDVHLTIGGVKVDELYRLRKFTEQPETLAGRLEQMDGLLDDPRVNAAATAARRMVTMEDFTKQMVGFTKERQEEYRVAIAALDSVTTDVPKDETQVEDVAEAIVSMARDVNRLDILADLLDMGARAARVKREAEARGEEPTEASDG